MSSTSPRKPTKNPHEADNIGCIDWLSEEGQARLRDILEPLLPYKPESWQLVNVGRLLMGMDVLCVTATGDGNSALFYLYGKVVEDCCVPDEYA